jgi:hypothetical protein
MEDLIKALNIFLKYGNPPYPTHCEHDTLLVMIDPKLVSEEDKKELEELGFNTYEGNDYFSSFKFGSC